MGGLPRAGTASTGSDGARWRTFEVVTRVEVANPAGPTRVWLPMPLAVDTDYQKSLGQGWTGNASTMRVFRATVTRRASRAWTTSVPRGVVMRPSPGLARVAGSARSPTRPR